MTALFQLAICGGSLAIPQDLVPRDKTPKTKEQPQAECDKSAAALPSAGTRLSGITGVEDVFLSVTHRRFCFLSFSQPEGVSQRQPVLTTLGH